MDLYAKTVTDGTGDEEIVIGEHGRQAVPLVVLDWVGLKRLLEELPENKLLAKVKLHAPDVIAELKKEIDNL